MSRLSREVLKERLNQAIFDALDELETEFDSIDKQADTLTDAVFAVLSESDSEELDTLSWVEDDPDADMGSEEAEEV